MQRKGRRLGVFDGFSMDREKKWDMLGSGNAFSCQMLTFSSNCSIFVRDTRAWEVGLTAYAKGMDV